MGQIFEIGDRVFDIRWGWGEVVDHLYGDYLIKFHPTNPMLYNEISMKMVSFTEYTLEGFSQERPEVLPKKGDIVWVRDDKNEEWKIMHFIGLHPTSSYKYRVSRMNSYSNTTDYMYMTTTNPYANEHN